jgi:hypothetical protein
MKWMLDPHGCELSKRYLRNKPTFKARVMNNENMLLRAAAWLG